MPRNRIKRQQVAAEDGWTVITHGLANVSLVNAEKSSHGDDKGKRNAKDNSTGKKGTAFVLPDVISDITAEKLLAEFKMLQERWRQLGVAGQIDGIFGGRAGRKEAEAGEEGEKDMENGKKDDWDIREAMCIGIGSFSRDWVHRWRSLWQLVLFVDVVGKVIPKDTQIQPITCYATDPAFTQIDTEFLSLLHISALPSSPTSSPSPSSVITSQTFLYSPFVDWFLLLPTFLKDKDPAVYIGNEVLSDYTLFAQTTEKREMLEMCNEVGRKWSERRRCVKLKEGVGVGASASALGGLVVYLREGEGDKFEC
ncbi:hypothetical protein PtrCC142_003543 [Pyrenophora tritici-repentis]|nr:SRR1 multi-domain protein [Pyrenophora tritici-repentis]KAI1583599.1 SRR1 domain containing protein [Pyrenophora tritici-repentis]KAI1604308.1 hypothetical protein PtrCC142_003543 [Pyrenophora tritici-repentis]